MAADCDDAMKSKCTICEEEFDSVEDMKKHVFLAHAKKSYVCTVCKKGFYTFSLLKQHSLEHEQKNHTCNICKKKFELLSDFECHLRKHAGEDQGHPDSCTVCTAGFEESGDSELNCAVHAMEDVLNGTTSSQSTSLKQGLGLKKIVKENAPVSYVCEDCKVVFMKSAEYVKHLLTHKRESYKFFCEFCNKGFTQSAEFEKHLDTHDEVRAYVCEQCDEIFKRYSKFEEHLLTHKEKKPRICDTCKLAFVEVDEYEKHMLIHADVGNSTDVTLVDKFVDNLGFNSTNDVLVDCSETEPKEQKPHVCDRCKIAFTSRNEFEAHLLTHEKIKMYDCKTCSEKFTESEEFAKHLLSHKSRSSFPSTPSLAPTHSNEFEKFLQAKSSVSSYSCDSCTEVFTQWTDFKDHKLNCGEKKGYKCYICKEMFAFHSELVKHYSKHGKNKFVCWICSEEFPLKFLLNKHVQTHSNITKENNGTVDNAADSVKRKATRSRKEVTFEDPLVKESPNSCSLLYMPEKSGPSKVPLKKVLILPSVKEEILSVKKHRYNCKVCDKTYTRTSGLKSHLISHLGRKLYYECKNCAKIFLHKSSRKIHQRTHAKVQNLCTICDITFLHSNQYTKHLLTHMKEETHDCQICGGSFPQASELAHHIRSHSCKICGDVFEDPVDLRLHFLSHTEDRPYSCQICSSDFVWNSCLDKNTKLETAGSSFGETQSGTASSSANYQSTGNGKKEDKRYLCDICGEKFTSSFKLTNHLFHHGGENPYECQFCKKRFSVRSKLKSHNCTHTR